MFLQHLESYKHCFIFSDLKANACITIWCFLSEALVHISENFLPPWKWLLEYFISRLSFRTQVDIHVSSHQSFIHKTLCSAEQFRDNMGNQKSKGLWPICIFHSNIWSVLFKSHLLILLWELSENFISFLSLWLYYFKNFKLNEMVALYKVRGRRHWWLHIYPFSSLSIAYVKRIWNLE